MKCKQIVFTEKNKAELLTVDVNEPAPNQVMVKTMVSTISCGTERANLTGDPNVNATGASGVVFPRMSGYNSAGIVVKKGADVKSVEVGDFKIVSAKRCTYYSKFNVAYFTIFVIVDFVYSE